MPSQTEFSRDDLQLMLAQGHETSGVEFKPAGECRGYLLAQVARAVLGLANRRDGGFVIVGVDEDANGVTPRGLTEDALKSWSFDDVSAQVNAYADPSVEFELFTPELDAKVFVVLHVAEFATVPVLCRKGWTANKESGGKSVLRQGACYVRSSSKPETSEIPTQTEMRELLDIATEKRLRAYFSLSAAAGLAVSDLARTAAANAFGSEPGLPEGAVLEEIRSRGHWDIAIHPLLYDRDRLDPGELQPVFDRCTVKLGGWMFPVATRAEPFTIEADAIVQNGFRWNHYKEVWRFSTSARFMGASAFWEEWRDQSGLWPPDQGWKPGGRISVTHVLRMLLGIYEFASRLATAVPGVDDFVIRTTARGLKGRELYVDDSRWFLPGAHVASSDRWPFERQLSRSALARESGVLALDAARRLFAMFGFSPPAGQLEGVAHELKPGKL
jgi:hypothetical protein